jgi:hypothetical protein
MEKDLKQKHQFIKSSYDPLIGNPTAERYSDLCKDMFELASIGATTVDNYTIVKNHVLECYKKLSGPRSEQIPPSQSLQMHLLSIICPIIWKWKVKTYVVLMWFVLKGSEH